MRLRNRNFILKVLRNQCLTLLKDGGSDLHFLNIRLCNPASVGLSVNWEEMRAEGREPSEKKREHI